MNTSLIERVTPPPTLSWPALRRFFQAAWRYGLSASGPISISAAHFIAAVILLRALSPNEFGLFSFVLILVPFCLSTLGALLGPSISAAIVQAQGLAKADVATHMKANLAFSALAMSGIAALMFLSGAGIVLALIFGLYGGLMTLRGFARTYSYAIGNQTRVALSDFAYSSLLLAGLLNLLSVGHFTILNASLVFALSTVVAFVPLGAVYLREQFWPRSFGSLLAYKVIWREWARWSVLGVVLTEVTVNAHAYLVTFVCGSKSFALLAAGAVFMRPVTLCLSALPDLERPSMARNIAAGQIAQAQRSVRDFRLAAGTVWFATLALAVGLLVWFPQLVLKSDYARDDIFVVVGLWALIMAVRAVRTPESVLLQAAREFRPLAKTAVWSSTVSLIATLFLLFTLGPIASLGGILIGDLVMTSGILMLSRKWRQRHG